MVQAASDAAENLPEKERQAAIDRAVQQAGKVGQVSDAEFSAILNSAEGLSLAIWTIFERRYPQVVTRTDVLRMIATGVLPAEKIAEIMQAISLAMGVDPAGERMPRSDKRKSLRGKQ